MTKSSNRRMKRNKVQCLASALLIILVSPLKGQMLNIDSCYALAKANYPFVRQYALVEKSREYSIDNANKGYLPQFSISGQATYQSEVTQLPISLPNITIPELSKDQYKLYGEVSQPVTDLFTIGASKALLNANAEAEEQKVEVELFNLKERISTLYFGILLTDAQIAQTELFQKDIKAGMDKTNTAIANGIALKSSLDELTVQMLQSTQHLTELKATRKGYADMLSLFINQPITENTTFEMPVPKIVSSDIVRPELQLYNLQQKAFEVQRKIIDDKNLPRFNLFFQGGLGRPALNMLSNSVSGYYIGGLRLTWNLSSFYSYNTDEKVIEINKSNVDVQRDVFLFNTNLTLQQQIADVNKLQEMVTSDDEIIALRESIKNTARNQLESGTITATDYINYINAEEQARQTQLLHKIQLLAAQYNYQVTMGD